LSAKSRQLEICNAKLSRGQDRDSHNP